MIAVPPSASIISLRRILSITQRKDIHSEILSSCLITDLLTRILIENDTENLSLGFMPAYLKTVLKEIDQHFQEPLSLESLAITAGVSKYHLACEFKKYLGMPPNEYLIVTRLNYSKTLLKYEDLTIEEIAYSCGFHQVSHYINLFKKHEGCTPLKFRREWHSNEAIKPPDAQ